jgi:hypothetical protein
MPVYLTRNEIDLLKALKAAGEKGRLASRTSGDEGVDRLVRANYVKVKSTATESVMYFITQLGSQVVDRQ